MSNLPTDAVDAEGWESLIPLILDEFMDDPAVVGDTKAYELASNGLYRGELQDCLDTVDDEPFPFEESYNDYSAYMDALRNLNDAEIVKPVRSRRRMGLTESGQQLAEHLRDGLTDDQQAAIAAAVEVVDE